MIEKCSIGNMSYNLKNIALLLLILILMIVIIYYIRNITTKHDELIEKYTMPTTTNANIVDTEVDKTQDTDSAKYTNFPTSETIVSLRPCQVQFNNTFDTDGTGTHKYIFEDDWKEIDTIKIDTDSPRKIKKKIISVTNETNNDDKDSGGRAIFTNYSEESKCFKKMSGKNNKYKYQENALITYNTNNHAVLNVDTIDKPENYMQMAFSIGGDIAITNKESYYTNLISSICSLKYDNTVSGLNGKLIRLLLNADNYIIEIKRVNIDPVNNHLFNIDPTFEISSLITSGNSSYYNYNTISNLYEYVTTNSTPSSTIISLYKFDRNLLCDKTYETKTYQDIKTYKKLNNAMFSVSAIINFNLPPAFTISNTTLPVRYKNYNKIIGTGLIKTTLLGDISDLIRNEIIEVNKNTNNSIISKIEDKKSLETSRNTFISTNNTKQFFIDNAIIKNNYNNKSLKYNALLNASNYNLRLNEFKYIDKKFDFLSSEIVELIEPIFTEEEKDIYETKIFTYNGIGDFTDYDIDFDDVTECDILIVAGGGGGGMDMGGGGGGGGFIELNKVRIVKGKHNIRVGRGGNGAPAGGTNGQPHIHQFVINAQKGYDSFFGTHNAIGGGYGGSSHQPHILGGQGGDGGSGGGSSGYDPVNSVSKAGRGVEGQGFRGGFGGEAYYSGGGGGAGGVGGGPSTAAGGAVGGIGKPSSILGTEYFWGGGGGGGGYSTSGGNGGLGGGGGGATGITKGGAGYFEGQPGGGGHAKTWTNTPGGNGGKHTGGGGGGGSHYNRDNKGGDGGSGIVVIRYKLFAKIQEDKFSKKITLQNERNFTHIYRNNGTLILKNNTKAEILIVGGGGGGGGGIGGGGGAGAVVHIPSADIPQGTYTITIGEGGAGNYRWGASGKGTNSSIINGNETIKIIAEGGGGTTGGHDHGDGSIGGSGGGAAGPNSIMNTGGAVGNSSSFGGFIGGKIYGNRGGNNTLHRRDGMTNAAGGGGAGNAAADTDPSGGVPGNGGDGKMFNISGSDIFYGGGGGGGGHYIPGVGGNGGGGNGYSSDNGGPGAINSGGGGGGGAWADTLGGSGGSGIVIIKYDNTITKKYKFTVEHDRELIITDRNNPRKIILKGTYIITISPTTTTLLKGTDVLLTFDSNRIDIIYDIYKKTDIINEEAIKEKLSKTYTMNGTAISYDNTKYNRYKINTYISKTYKDVNNGVKLNVYLYSNNSVKINSNNYNIRYEYLKSTDTDNLINVNIYITIKPIIMSVPFTSFTIKTYLKTSNGGDGDEIYAFIGNGPGIDLSTTNTFNGISDVISDNKSVWITSLIDKDVWGIVATDRDLTTFNSSLVTEANIVNKCNSGASTHICDIKKLLEIKISIADARTTATTAKFKSNIRLTAKDLFPLSNVNPILNYNITDYISFESSKQKAPSNRSTQFNILDSATKYVYFSIP